MAPLPDLGGIISPLTTPFDVDGDLELHLVHAQVRWLLDAGVHGLVVGDSTGEGQTLEVDELVDLVRAVLDEVDGRVPVIAGIIADGTRDAVHRGRALRGRRLAALLVTPVHFVFRPGEEATVAYYRAIAEATGFPVIVDNVVPWSTLAPELVLCLLHDVPGVVGVKQSVGEVALLADLLRGARPEERVLGAIDRLLEPAFAHGAHGAIAAILAAAPRPCVELWAATRAGDEGRAKALQERLLPLCTALDGPNLPARVKLAQQLQGVPAGHARAPMADPDGAERAAIESALAALRG